MKSKMPDLKVGDQVYDSGDAFEWERLVTITENNINIIQKFWNKLYFTTQCEAHKKASDCHAAYMFAQGDAACY